MTFVKLDTAGLVRALSGTWATMSSNSQSQFTLGSDGRILRILGVGVWRQLDRSIRQRYAFKVHVENGKVYWNEYYFGGVLYGKSN